MINLDAQTRKAIFEALAEGRAAVVLNTRLA